MSEKLNFKARTVCDVWRNALVHRNNGSHFRASEADVKRFLCNAQWHHFYGKTMAWIISTGIGFLAATVTPVSSMPCAYAPYGDMSEGLDRLVCAGLPR
ncbi:hypothetical protein [Burkholderia gladioli]|uniref:hypothetical protein n=1 Tax=Burkholderia gladioli TaxID=28095 RepID=UPI0013DE4D43|nr:hypothetical protein [Burkholderia gladioli]